MDILQLNDESIYDVKLSSRVEIPTAKDNGISWIQPHREFLKNNPPRTRLFIDVKDYSQRMGLSLKRAKELIAALQKHVKAMERADSQIQTGKIRPPEPTEADGYMPFYPD